MQCRGLTSPARPEYEKHSVAGFAVVDVAVVQGGGPVEAGGGDHALFEIAEQAAEDLPAVGAAELQITLEVHAHDAVGVDACGFEVVMIQLFRLHHREELLAGHFDEFHDLFFRAMRVPDQDGRAICYLRASLVFLPLTVNSSFSSRASQPTAARIRSAGASISFLIVASVASPFSLSSSQTAPAVAPIWTAPRAVAALDASPFVDDFEAGAFLADFVGFSATGDGVAAEADFFLAMVGLQF